MKRKLILIVAPPLVTLQDITGPWEVFCRAEQYQPGTYTVKLVSTEASTRVRTKFGLDIDCTTTIFDIREEADTILIGGSEEGVKGRVSKDFELWLHEMLPRTRRMGSVCTGAFYLAHIGLLEGRRATTHWRYLEQLSTHFPNLQVDAKPIYVRDDKFYTSAGITAGIDLAMHMVAEDCSFELAHMIARDLVVFVQRQADQPQLSRSLTQRLARHDAIRRLQLWAPDHLHRLQSVDDMARWTNMSQRNFARLFKQQTGVTPGAYLRQLRREAARCRASGDLPRQAVAEEVGFGSTRSLRRSLQFSLAADSKP